MTLERTGTPAAVRGGGRYRALGGVPGLPGLLVWGAAARLHQSMTLVALVVVAADATGSYALAGVVCGALVLGQGLAGPLRGRAVDRRRAGPLLVTTSAAYGLGVLALSLLPRSGWVPLAMAAMAVGLALPPATQVARAKTAQLAGGATVPQVRHTAFAVQSVTSELVSAIGPGLAALGIAIVGAQATLAVSGALATVGGLGLAAAVRRAAVDRPADPQPRPPARGGRPIGLIAAMTLVVASYAALSLALIGWGHARGSAPLGAMVYAGCSAGALLGGLVVGARGPGRRPLAVKLVAMAGAHLAVASTLPPVAALPVWLIAAVGLAAGSTAPAAVVAIYDRLADAVPPQRRAETFGWLATATTAGGAAASPLAGWLVDRGGPATAAAAAAALVLLAALISTPTPRSPITPPTRSRHYN